MIDKKKTGKRIKIHSFNKQKISSKKEPKQTLKKSVGVLLLFGLIVLLSGANRFKGLQDDVFIIQNNKTPSFYNGMFHLDESPFEIIVNHVSPEDNIEIFVYDTPEMFYRYSWPERIADTVTFAPATGMAMELNSDKSFSLCINEENTKNYVSGDRRINSGGKAILRINGFVDLLERKTGSEVFYISIFIDGNKNQIVEKKEVAHFIVSKPMGEM